MPNNRITLSLIFFPMHRRIKDIIAHHSVKFAIVGALGTLFNLAIMALLVEQANLSPLFASAAATEPAIVHNFLLNNFWTFGSATTAAPWPAALPGFTSSPFSGW